VKLDALHAAWTAPIRGLPVLQVRDCSEWPERRGCAQACIHRA
jgi:hypothetical protein